MNFARISKSLASVGVVGALAGGALVGATATSADAAVAGGATYTCETSLGPVPMAVQV